MEEQTHTDHDIDSEIRRSVPEIVPWRRFPECAMCGHNLGGNWLFARIYAARGNTSQIYGFCTGGRDSTVKVPIPILGHVEAETGCFGIYQPHLHLRCGRCGYSWLMAVKKAK